MSVLFSCCSYNRICLSHVLIAVVVVKYIAQKVSEIRFFPLQYLLCYTDGNVVPSSGFYKLSLCSWVAISLPGDTVAEHFLASIEDIKSFIWASFRSVLCAKTQAINDSILSYCYLIAMQPPFAWGRKRVLDKILWCDMSPTRESSTT